MEVSTIFPQYGTGGTSIGITNEATRASRATRSTTGKVRQKRRRPFCGQRFLVLTLMTTCVLLFHTPQQVYVTWWFITQIDIPSVLAPFNLMLAVPSVMDPILFTMTLTDVRRAMLKFFRRSA
ncbi:hypothetical protein RvY_11498 [Ramazzottius varieornatus]|uniref:Uncharacterized protein n=1 Tax=Ramazzottius varieornatus TaxID=947166 RepID=A0A1D1VP30_RAMVA|nr:hypothetical protein RvY_11498 [Ramazzottius varieornatus]